MPVAIILDDLQMRHDAFKHLHGHEYAEIFHTYNFADFFHILTKYPGVVDFVSLDHDLGDWTSGSQPVTQILHGTGMDAVRLLEILPFDMRPKMVNVHSHNYVRGEIMQERLVRAGYVNATYTHFTDE